MSQVRTPEGMTELGGVQLATDPAGQPFAVGASLILATGSNIECDAFQIGGRQPLVIINDGPGVFELNTDGNTFINGTDVFAVNAGESALVVRSGPIDCRGFIL